MRLHCEESSVLRGVYPLQRAATEGRLEHVAMLLHEKVARLRPRKRTCAAIRNRLAGAVERFNALDETTQAKSLRDARRALLRGSLSGTAVEGALSVVAAIAARVWSDPPNSDDLSAALAMVHGKCSATEHLTDGFSAAALAAATAALARVPVHLICRDEKSVDEARALLVPMCERLGLSLASVGSRTSLEERRQAYRLDLVIVPANELVLDALRDTQRLADEPGDLRLRLERLYSAQPRTDQLILRGLGCGILADAEMVLLDQALNTLALNAVQSSSEEVQAIALAYDVSGLLLTGSDFTVGGRGWPELAATGRKRLHRMLHHRGGLWSAPQWREELASLALLVRHGLHPGVHYRDGGNQIELIDASLQRRLGSGYRERIVRGLLALKCGKQPEAVRGQIATASYLQTFRRYTVLGGIVSSQDPDVRRELWWLYRLKVICHRCRPGTAKCPVELHLLPEVASKLQAVNDAVVAARGAGGSVLVLAAPGENMHLLQQHFQDRDLRYRMIDPDIPSAEHDTGNGPLDAVIVVERSGVIRAPNKLLSDTIVSTVFLDAPRERRHQRARTSAVSAVLPGVAVQQLLAADDPLLQAAPLATVAGFVLRLGLSMPALGRQLARMLFHFALNRRTLAMQRLRREHRAAEARLAKLLAFTGSRR